MTPERWRQIEDLYHSARERGPSALSGADPELREEVEKLLAQTSEGGSAILNELKESLISHSARTQVGVGSRLGPYSIESLLGSGGMGRVFCATDTRLGRKVAIKVSQERFTDRFEREARAIAALNHPNVCTLYDVGPDYLVMELLDGETLAARLKRGKLSIEQTISFGTQIAAALAAAHTKGVIHRDLKPGNIILTRTGVKVLDFGLAKLEQDQRFTQPDAVMGTPAYMAPEQRHGNLCDARTDIYALGLVLSEMATGEQVLPGGKPRTDILPERLGHLVQGCLAEDPEERWQSARDVRRELEWAAQPEQASRAAKLSVRTSLWLGFAILATFGLAIFAFFHFHTQAPEAPVMYSSIVPPPKTSFDFHGLMSLSPDGRSVVFAAAGQDGKRQLYLRRLDQPAAEPLDEGTQDGAYPFWSPNSRWIAFFADGMLKKISTQGGQPIALAKGDGEGGSWSPKGVIVFATTTFAPLLKISSDGGNTSTAVVSDAAIGTAHGFPWFLPDGEHFLFVSWVGAGHMTIRVGSINSSATTLIGETDSDVEFADGRLLYLRGNSLVARPFDLKNLRASGEPVPVAEHVGRFQDLIGTGAFSVSSTGLLAYQRGASADVRQLTWIDRAGKPLATVGDPRAFYDIEFSPDRRSLTASAPDGTGNFDLWLYDMTRGLPARFTFDPAGEYFGIWSPDGRSVIFNSTRKGRYDLYRKSANGAGTEDLLYADDTDKVPTSWSQDGKFLLYFTGGGERYKMYLLPLTPDQPGAGLKPKALHDTLFDEVWPQFSPDDRWIAYSSDESGQREIYVAPVSKPTEEHQVSFGGGDSPRWSKDGRKVFYQAGDGQLMEAEVNLKAATIEVGAVRRVFTRTTQSGGYSWDVSADGQRALVGIPVATPAEPFTLVQNWMAVRK